MDNDRHKIIPQGGTMVYSNQDIGPESDGRYLTYLMYISLLQFLEGNRIIPGYNVARLEEFIRRTNPE